MTGRPRRAHGALALWAAACAVLPAQAAPGAPASPSWHRRRLAEVREALSGDRSSPRAFALLHEAWDLRHGLGDDAAVAELFDEVEADGSARPLLRDHALWNRAALHTRHGETDRAAQAMRRLGFPEDLEVVGPFENLGDAGRSEPFEPELDGGAGPFEGAEGEVRWRRLPGLGRLGRVDLPGLLARGDDAVAYVRATVPSAEDRAAVVRLGADDSYTLWLNGDVAGQFAGHRGARFDQDAHAVTLRKGDNVLLLKLAWTGSGGTFYLRIDEADGDGAWHPLTAFAADVQRAAAAATDGSHALLGELHLAFGAADRRDELDVAEFKAAIGKAPPDRRAAWLEGLGRSLGADDDARRAAFEQAWDAGGPDVGARVRASAALVRHYRARQDQAKATLWAKRLETVDPAHTLVFQDRADRWRWAGARRMALREIRRGRRALPDDPTLAAAEAATLGVLKDRKGQREALAAYLRLEAADGERLRELSRLRLDAADVDGALEARRRILALWPYSLTDRMAVVRLLAENGREAAALEELRALRQEFPESPEPCDAEGRLLHRLGRTEEGLAAMDRALMIRPQDRRLRRYVEHLRPDEESLEAAFAVPLDDVLSVPAPPGADEVGAFVALHVGAVRVHENGLSSSFVQTVARVTGRSQLDAMREWSISYVPGQEVVEVLQAERIDAAGDRHKPTSERTVGPFGKSQGMYLNNKARRIEFSDLQPGDAVHLRYRIDEVAGRNMFGDYFGNVVHLQRPVPTGRLIQAYEMPAGRALYHAGRGAGAPVVGRRGDRTTYRWEWEDVPPLVTEPSMPGYTEVGSFLSVSTAKDWGEMAAWYSRLIADQFDLEEEDKALARRLVEGATSAHDKVARLHRWVVDNTRYVGIEFGIHGFKPYQAARVIRRGYGDCKDKATLLSAMLAEVGVEGRVALVRTVGRGRLDPTPATLRAFNHAITYVPDLDLWIDGTHEFSGTRHLPHRDQGAMALVVDRKGGGELTTTPIAPAAANSWATTVEGELLPDGALRLRAREVVSGQGAESLRRSFQDASERVRTLEKMLSRHHPGVKVEKVDFEALDDYEADPALVFEAIAPAVLEIDGDRASLPVALYPSRLTERVAPGSERIHDVVLDHAWQERGQLTVRLPPGWTVEALPDDVSLVGRHGEAEITTAVQGRDVVVTSRLSVTARRAPVAEYAALRALALAVDRADGGRIRLVRSRPTPAEPPR